VDDDDTYDLLVTSPPFLALRSYLSADHPDKHREIGSEPTPAAFLDTLYGLTADWGALIPEWGSICVELGDTFSDAARAAKRFKRKDDGWPLAKSACAIPQLYYVGLIYGLNPLTGTPSPAGQWRARNWITWARPNPPVGSLGKRNPHKRTGDHKFRPACSHITVACRGTGRYFDLDAVRTGHARDYTSERPGGDTEFDRRPAQARKNGARTLVADPAGAPPLDWHTDQLDGDWLWKLATAPYPGAHYATYPLALPRRLVLAMCPARVCSVCGWPSERVTKATRVTDGNYGRPHAFGKSERNGRDFASNADTTITTLGWTDCECSPEGCRGSTEGWVAPLGSHWRPGRVLDPFAGSGTTAVAAALEGRDCVLIDLDHRNVELVDKRITEHLSVISRVDDGNTVTWTVEPYANKCSISGCKRVHKKHGLCGPHLRQQRAP